MPGKAMERIQGHMITPWALADIARVSIVHSNKWRNDATEQDVIECCKAYNAIDDPDLAEHGTDAVGKFLLRTACEQFIHQHVNLSNMSRAAALFFQTEPMRPLQVLTDEWDFRLLECSLVDFIGVGRLVHLAAHVSNGRFNPDWIYRDGFELVTSSLSKELFVQILYRHYASDVEKFKKLNSRHYHKGPYRRFSYNPLAEAPVVEGLAEDLLVPVPGMLMFRYSTLGIYHLGVQQWGSRFTEDVGNLFEAYVGRQLGLVTEGTLIPSIEYARDRRKSVDWILVLDEAVLLVEVKSVRPTDPVRTGADAAKAEMSRMLARAFEQLATTDRCIDEGLAEFAEVPRDRPRFGLVVTLEDFWVANTFIHREWYAAEHDQSRVIVSAQELEHLVVLPATEIAAKLTQLTTSEEVNGWSLGSLLVGLGGRNPILDSAWNLPTGFEALTAEAERRESS